MRLIDVIILGGFLGLASVPERAMAQQNQGGGIKPEATVVVPAITESQTTRNSFDLTFEAVDQYHGMVVGEIFARKPAPRVMGRYTRNTSSGSFYVDSWNSIGAGYNMEADLGLGWNRKGWDISYTHFAVRGGDIAQFSLIKSGNIRVARHEVSLGANLIYYAAVKPSSPPGGVVGKIFAGTSHRIPGLGKSFSLGHRVAIGADDNPFGLGDGISMIGFYSPEIGFKGMYFGWNASVPLAGKDNTTRGFRESFSAGFRHSFNW
jgi:hypothetical protein